MIAFLHISKTGGTTLKFILRNSFGVRHCDVLTIRPSKAFSDAELRFARWFYPGLQSISGHHIKPWAEDLSGDVRYYTFLRDPVKRFLSQYQQQLGRLRGDRRRRALRGRGLKRARSFEEFLEDRGNLQVKRLAGSLDVDRAKDEIRRKFFFVGLTSRFDESLRVLQALSPYPIDIRYTLRKQAPDNSVRDEILADPEKVARVRAANSADLKLYDWVQYEFYPEQLRSAGLTDGEDGGGLQAPEEEIRSYRYVLCRGYNNGVYKQALKLRKAWVREEPRDPTPGDED